MTRDKLIQMARAVDEARGAPELSTEATVRKLCTKVDAGEIGEDVEIDPETRAPRWIVETVPRLLESWRHAPSGAGAAFVEFTKEET